MNYLEKAAGLPVIHVWAQSFVVAADTVSNRDVFAYLRAPGVKTGRTSAAVMQKSSVPRGGASVQEGLLERVLELLPPMQEPIRMYRQPRVL